MPGIVVSGNTVNTRNAFYSRKSCAEIAAAYQDVVGPENVTGLPDTGEYYITRFDDSDNQLKRDLVWCDFSVASLVTVGTAKYTGWTYKAITDGIELTYPDPSTDQSSPTDAASNPSEGSCAQYGMRVARFNNLGSGFQSALREEAKSHFCNANLRGAHAVCQFINYGTPATAYLCEVQMAAETDFAYKINTANQVVKTRSQDTISGKTRSSAPSHDITHDQIAHAEQGKYIIEYRVNDLGGNPQCKVGKRTVVVKDTLPPVIMLHWGTGKPLIHKSSSAQRGIGNVPNTPWDPLTPSHDEARDAIANGNLTQYPATVRHFPSYVAFLPDTGCAQKCTTGQPCGKSCINAGLTCNRAQQLSTLSKGDWTACDSATYDAIMLADNQLKPGILDGAVLDARWDASGLGDVAP